MFFSANANRFSKFFHQVIRKKIYTSLAICYYVDMSRGDNVQGIERDRPILGKNEGRDESRGA